MSGVELLLAFLAGVFMGGALDRLCCRSSSMRGSTDCAGMGDQRGDDADQRRADVYCSARIGAAAALTRPARPFGRAEGWLIVPDLEPSGGIVT